MRARSKKFYENLLGMKTVLKPENLRHRGGIWFQCGTQEVHISIQDDYIPAKKRIQLLSWKISRRLDVNWHIRAAFFLKKSLLQERAFFVHDPFGNRLEFYNMTNKRPPSGGLLF